MALKLGPLTIPFLKSADDKDPYWQFFLNEVPADPKNVTVEMIRKATEGAINPVKSELHSPEITASHLKELALYLKAVSCGIVDLSKQPPEIAQGYRFGVLCVVPAEYDPRTYAGIGGQAAIQRGLYVTFVVAAYCRELGVRATALPEPDADRLAAVAGLGTLNKAGRLVVPKYGSQVYVADLIRTDLPLAADG